MPSKQSFKKSTKRPPFRRWTSKPKAQASAGHHSSDSPQPANDVAARMNPWEDLDGDEYEDISDYSDELGEDDEAESSHHEVDLTAPNPLHPNVFDKLPVELIADIFLEISYTLPQEARAALPCLLSSICRRFRFITITTALLWTVIVVPPKDRPVHHLSDYLERSAGLPLTVIINLFPNIAPFERRSTFRPRITPLYPEAHRWHRLEVRMAQAWKEITSVLPPELPGLEVLRVCSDENRFFQSIIKTPCPHLRRIETERMLLTWTACPFTCIEELTVTHAGWKDVDWDHFPIFLNQNTRLRRMKLEMLSFAWTEFGFSPAKSTKPTLPHLESLHILSIAGGKLVPNFLWKMQAPLLRELILEGVGDTHQYKWTGPIRFEFPSLQRLVLHNIRGVDDMLAQCLPLIPSLTHLVVTGIPSLEGLPSVFTPLMQRESPPSCPLLQTITTKSVSPHNLRQVLQLDTFRGRRVTLNMHIDGIALSMMANQEEFDTLSTSLAWLRENCNLRLFGRPSEGLYRSFAHLESRSWRDHSLAMQDVWLDDEAFELRFTDAPPSLDESLESLHV